MKERRMAVLFMVAIMAVCPLLVIGNTDADTPVGTTDWESTYGSLDTPYVSAVSSVTTGYKYLHCKWYVEGTLSGMSSNWNVPGSAISVGNYVYYYDTNASKLVKAKLSDGTEVASAQLTMDTMYCVHVTYGDGKLYVPALEGTAINIHIFDASTMAKITDTKDKNGETDGTVKEAQGMQGPVVYHNGYIYVSTYGHSEEYNKVNLACYDKDGKVKWGDSSGTGYYNAIPAFITFGGTEYLVIADKGFTDSKGNEGDYTKGGATLRAINATTGEVFMTKQIGEEYVNSGVTYYKGRLYVATTNKISGDTASNANPLRTSIHSFTLTESGFGDEKTWTSPSTGGCQAQPVIYNDRIYLGSGGEVAEPGRGISVISIANNGTMTLAYEDNTYKTKSSVSVSTGLDGCVYFYYIPYDGTGSKPDVVIGKDQSGQTSSDIKAIDAGGNQYSFQSVVIATDGSIIVRNDNELMCFVGSSVLMGDPNGDGNVTPSDAVVALKAYVGLVTLTDNQKLAADCNGDGNVTPSDAVLILKKYVGLRLHL